MFGSIMADSSGESSGEERSYKSDKLLHSELLCFIVDKSQFMTPKDMTKLCADFYKEEEVVAARVLINDHCGLDAKNRLRKRKGPDRMRATLEDIIKAVVHPTVELPHFYALNLSRLPPVDAAHCDMAAVLKELSFLRQEVRAVNELREEIRGVQELRKEVDYVRKMVDEGLYIATKQAKPVDQMIYHSDQVANLQPVSTFMTAPTYAMKAKEGIESGSLKPRPILKHTVGSSTINNKIKAVPTIRKIDLFVTRLHPDTTRSEIEESITSSNDVENPVHIADIVCNKLNSRFESLYCSYHVQIGVDSVDMKRAIDLFMCANTWPAGILVRRYFKPKTLKHQQEFQDGE